MPNAHLGAHEYAFSMRGSVFPLHSTLEPVRASSGAPNLYAHINHAFARAVTAFHVQPRQDCCGPWWGGGVQGGGGLAGEDWAETAWVAVIVCKQEK